MIDIEFIRGFAYAVANLNRMHDEPSMCRDMLVESGFTFSDFDCVCEYDRSEIVKIWRDVARPVQS